MPLPRLPEGEDPELYTWVWIKHKKNGRLGIMQLFNEAEVNRRLDILQKQFPEPLEGSLRPTIEAVIEFHRKRRADWPELKKQIVLADG